MEERGGISSSGLCREPQPTSPSACMGREDYSSDQVTHSIWLCRSSVHTGARARRTAHVHACSLAKAGTAPPSPTIACPEPPARRKRSGGARSVRAQANVFLLCSQKAGVFTRTHAAPTIRIRNWPIMAGRVRLTAGREQGEGVRWGVKCADKGEPACKQSAAHCISVHDTGTHNRRGVQAASPLPPAPSRGG